MGWEHSLPWLLSSNPPYHTDQMLSICSDPEPPLTCENDPMQIDACQCASPLYVLCSPLEDIDNLAAESLLHFQVLFRVVLYTEISTQALQDHVAILSANLRF